MFSQILIQVCGDQIEQLGIIIFSYCLVWKLVCFLVLRHSRNIIIAAVKADQKLLEENADELTGSRSCILLCPQSGLIRIIQPSLKIIAGLCDRPGEKTPFRFFYVQDLVAEKIHHRAVAGE